MRHSSISRIPCLFAAAAYALLIFNSCNKDELADNEQYVIPDDFAVNIPDPVFAEYCMRYFDQPEGGGNGDGILQYGEIKNVDIIDVYDIDKDEIPGTVSSLEGIEYFTSLKELRCLFQSLTSLDVSKNKVLEILHCDENQSLSSLDVSNNPELKELWCQYNSLTSIDVSKCPKLEQLLCPYNKLTSLDVTNNMALADLQCDYNFLTTLDISRNRKLKWLSCSGNSLSAIDVADNTELLWLYCYENSLTSLDLSRNTRLEELWCQSNSLTSLDISKNTLLYYLYCDDNRLTSLDISQNPLLEMLICRGNHLTSLDVSHLSSTLKYVYPLYQKNSNGERQKITVTIFPGWEDNYVIITDTYDYQNSPYLEIIER